MPISRKVLMRCKYCGFTTYRIIGDSLPDENYLKPCPKCKKNFCMEIIDDEDDNNQDMIDDSKND